MFKIAKKLTVIMLSASIIFSCSGIIAHAEGIKDKKQEYYQEYKRIIREANEKIGSKDFELLPIDIGHCKVCQIQKLQHQQKFHLSQETILCAPYP